MCVKLNEGRTIITGEFCSVPPQGPAATAILLVFKARKGHARLQTRVSKSCAATD